jgi:hypothetical protein
MNQSNRASGTVLLKAIIAFHINTINTKYHINHSYYFLLEKYGTYERGMNEIAVRIFV